MREYIPHMTRNEKRIIGYLIHHNDKMFTGAVDGGYAVTLISRKIVVRALQGGQAFDAEDTPFAIPDDVGRFLSRIRTSSHTSLPMMMTTNESRSLGAFRGCCADFNAATWIAVPRKSPAVGLPVHAARLRHRGAGPSARQKPIRYSIHAPLRWRSTAG